MALSALLSVLPGLLVDLGGLMLALVRWSRHPTASLLASLGLVLRLPSALATVWMVQPGLDAGTRFAVAGALGLLANLGLLLVVAAVFAGRGPAAAEGR